MSTYLRSDKPLAAIIGAIAAAAASSLCCLAPALYLVFGVSAAGLASLSKLAWLQIPMGAVAVLLLAYGFWRLYGSRRAICEGFLSRRKLVALYWSAVAIALILLIYPFALPLLLEEN
ncbi:MAG: hypothetical protein LBC09_07055 [Helicobacteraceae bacterium]|jgi:mercuric ion transport protein|nr:hypothetical protein [Helicobacteraceae bacterium]